MLINYHTTKCSICSARFKRKQWRVAVDAGRGDNRTFAVCEKCAKQIEGRVKVRYKQDGICNAPTLPTDTHK